MRWFAILIWNVIVFLVFGLDKLFARKKMRRIKESVLLSLAFLLGGTGALLGMVAFNHKTSKTRFRSLVPMAFVLNFVIIYVLTNKI